MFRRAFWFLSGVIAGISSLVWTKKRVAGLRDSMTEGSLSRRTFDGSAAVVRRIRAAIAVGREVMRQGDGTVAVGAPPRQTRRHIATSPRKTHG